MAKILGSGVIPPLVTPINADESVNYDHLKNVVDHVIDGGVDAVFINGSTGEFPRFTFETRTKLVAETVKIAAKRVPVLAGVSDAGLTHVLKNVKEAEKAGADALVVTPPYYYPVWNDDEAYSFFIAVAESTSLPVMLYNIPSTCGASISLDLVERLFPVKNIIGIKDSSGDRARLLDSIKRFKNRDKDFAVVIGAEELSYDGLKAGADGLVPSMGNPFPKLWSALYRASRDGNDARLKELCDLVNAMNTGNKFSDAWLTALVWRKKAMQHMGICNEYCTRPYVPVDDKADIGIRKSVETYRSMFM